MAFYKTTTDETKMLMAIAMKLEKKIKRTTRRYAEKKISPDDFARWKERVFEIIREFDEKVENINIKKELSDVER